MELTVFWTQFAENKLEDIFHFYKFEANIDVARRLVTGIVNQTIDLEKLPFQRSKGRADEKQIRGVSLFSLQKL